MSEANKEFFYQRFTLQGRLFHPAVLTPVPNKNNVLKFSALFAWAMNDPRNAAELQKINNFLVQAKQMFHPQIPQQFFMNPIKKWGEYVRQDGKPMPEYLNGHYWMNLTSGVEFPPLVVDKWKNAVMDKAEVFSGRNVALSFSFFNIDGKKNGGKYGIGANLVAIMLLDGGDKVAGSGAVDVNSVFGSFQADMGGAPQQNFQAPPAQNYGQPAQSFNPAQNQMPPQYGQQQQPAPQQAYGQPPAPQQNFAPQQPAQANPYGQQTWPPTNPGPMGNGVDAHNHAAPFNGNQAFNGSPAPGAQTYPSNGQQNYQPQIDPMTGRPIY